MVYTPDAPKEGQHTLSQTHTHSLKHTHTLSYTHTSLSDPARSVSEVSPSLSPSLSLPLSLSLSLSLSHPSPLLIYLGSRTRSLSLPLSLPPHSSLPTPPPLHGSQRTKDISLSHPSLLLMDLDARRVWRESRCQFVDSQFYPWASQLCIEGMQVSICPLVSLLHHFWREPRAPTEHLGCGS